MSNERICLLIELRAHPNPYIKTVDFMLKDSCLMECLTAMPDVKLEMGYSTFVIEGP